MLTAEDDESKEGLLDGMTDAWDHQHVAERQFPSSCATIMPWILLVFFFCTTLLFAWQSRASLSACQNSTYETGFRTDFASGPPGIPLKIIEKHFTNDLHFNTTSEQLYNVPLSTHETTYIGVPSPDIDQAWHDLLHDQYVAISESEAQQFPPEHRSLIDTGAGQPHYHFELSVFHYLHCLNEIRKSVAVDYDYYHRSERPNRIFSSREHIDHCIDQIRQAVQCHADLTPVPMILLDNKRVSIFIGNGEMHSCRDFEAVREWVKDRGEKVKALGDY